MILGVKFEQPKFWTGQKLINNGIGKDQQNNQIVCEARHQKLRQFWDFRGFSHDSCRDSLAILWMEEILHQLISGLSHNYRVSTIQGDAGFLPSTVCGLSHDLSPNLRICNWCCSLSAIKMWTFRAQDFRGDPFLVNCEFEPGIPYTLLGSNWRVLRIPRVPSKLWDIAMGNHQPWITPHWKLCSQNAEGLKVWEMGQLSQTDPTYAWS